MAEHRTSSQRQDGAFTRLSAHIEALGQRAQARGLRPGDIHFEVVPSRLLQALTAYGGILTRHRHWSFGKAYFRLRVAHEYRLTRMYELVVNARPALAYLLDSNTEVESLVVIAHVLAHVDFFQHHYRFVSVPGNMPERMAWSRDRLDNWAVQVGVERLEALMDDAMVLTDLLDPFTDDWQAPANVMAFVLHEAADLGEMSREVMECLYREARYFRPQLETKIANEGWATYWHRDLMRRYPLTPADTIEFARLHAQITAISSSVNPYALGLALWEQAATEEGESGLWQARVLNADTALVERYLTPSIALRCGSVRAENFADYRRDLLKTLDNGGLPRIQVGDVEQGELVLLHQHDGRDLDQRQLPGAMAALGRLWGRPCHLLTSRAGKPRRITWTGEGLVESG